MTISDAPGPRLSGIVLAAGVRQCILEIDRGRPEVVAQVGAMAGTWRVQAIADHSVTVERGGLSLLLRPAYVSQGSNRSAPVTAGTPEWRVGLRREHPAPRYLERRSREGGG